MPDLDELAKTNPLAAILLGSLAEKIRGGDGAGDPARDGMMFTGRGRTIGEALHSAFQNAGKPARPVEQDVARLLDAADRYQSGNPFAPRQLVTPRRDSTVSGAGRPHVVLAVLPEARPTFAASEPKHTASANYGGRLDMRVAEVCDCDHGEVRAFWVESWEFESWIAPAPAEAQDEPTA